MAGKLEVVSPLSIASKRLEEKRKNVTDQLQMVGEHFSSLSVQRDRLISTFEDEIKSIELEFDHLKETLDQKKHSLLEKLQHRSREEQTTLTSRIELVKEAIIETNKVVEEACRLQAESDQNTFFVSYSSVNNSLEEKFIKLLLLNDEHEKTHFTSARKVVDFSKVFDALNEVVLSDEGIYHADSSLLDCTLQDSVSEQEKQDLELTSPTIVKKDSPEINVLEVSSGTSMEVYVTDVCGPHKFTVQPVGSELVSMMESMGEFYSGDNFDADLKCIPIVGGFCCAKFSEDECWYRAKVVDYKMEEESRVTVCYVDYGNEEELPLDQLRPLHHRFCSLPSQALHCCLESVFPLLQDCLGAWCGVWSSSVCEWFANILLGKTVEVTTSKNASSDLVLLDVCLALSDVKKSVFPCCMFDLDFSSNFVQLSEIMKPIVNSVSNSSSEQDIVHLSDLPPLVVKLNSYLEFTCLVSHVAEDAHFYVHPIQEDLARGMTFIDDELHSHYSSEENRVTLPSECLKCGVLCAVYSVVFQQWCRGVVIRIKNELGEDKPLCLIFFLDYGGMEWIDTCKVFYLKSSVRIYPSQVVCCNFEEITGGDYDLEVLQNPDIAGLAQNCYVSSVKRKGALFRCVKFMRDFTEEKKLFCVVRGKELDSEVPVLVYKVSHVVPVEVYDTTGETDVHLNREIVAQLEESDIGDPEASIHLQHWNPMEDDYLSKRNVYAVDDEDAGLALEGYRSNARICSYYARGRTCYRGDECRFLHIQEGVSNKQMEAAVVECDYSITLPSKNDWIIVIVTAIINSTRFYVQLPLGCKSPISNTSLEEEDEGSELELSFPSLLKEMSDYYNEQVFNERELLLPHTGEVIAAYLPEDGCWYRGRVVDSKDDLLSVFLVDYGIIATLSDVHVRSLKPEYLILPFQAIECYLPNCTSANQQEARERFSEYVCDKVIVAKVIAVDANGCLGLELYCNTEDGGMSINNTLLEDSVLKIETFKPSSVISGSYTKMRPG